MMYKFISNMYLLGKITETELQMYIEKKFITSEQAEEIKALKVPISDSTTENASGISVSLSSLSW